MTGRVSVRSALALGLCLVVALSRPASAAILPAAALYADAQAKERAVRRALSESRPSPSVLKAVRTVIAQYEAVVRHYPTTVYGDDALWNAAQLSLEVYRKFRDAQDAAVAQRLLKRLSTEYPTSQWARQAAQQNAVELPIDHARRKTATDPPVQTEVVRESAPTPMARAAKNEAPGAVSLLATAPAATVTTLSPMATSGAMRTRPALVAASTTGAAGAPEHATTIIRIERNTLTDVVRLTITLSAEVAYREQQLTNPSRLFFDFARTRPSTSLMDRTLAFERDDDIIREVRVGRHPNQITRVVLDTEGTASCSAYPLYAPFRLVVDCVRATGRVARARPAASNPVVPTTGVAKAAPDAMQTQPALPRVAVPQATPAPLLGTPAPAPMPPPVLNGRRSAPLMASLPGRPPLTARTSAPASRTDLPAGRPSIDEAVFRGLGSESASVPPPIAAPPAPAAPAGNLAGGYSMARQLGLGVSRIVIDPGHGGHDPGAKGPGVTEAALVLDIALRLEQILKLTPGTEVILTRRGDVFVSLEERTAIANREHADLFLSIHANATTGGQVGGVETYFLNFATSRQAAAVAARENAAFGQNMSALPNFVKAIALNNKLEESRDFATQVQRALVQRLRPVNQGLRDLGVKQAPFVVLIGAAMPSVLTEVAFVTNDQEARLLKGMTYRQRIAEALAAAVQRYQASLAGGVSPAQP